MDPDRVSDEQVRRWRYHWEDRQRTSKSWWRHDTTQKPPYRPPSDWVYNTSAGPVEGKINVHIVPHTHDDTGWQITVDQYFYLDVYYVIDTVVRQLAEDPNKRFMYVETGFFARWWDQQPPRVKEMTKQLVQEGRLEFINGGWCMHDEASPYYVEMVDQTTRGHMFLKKNFGKAANPKGTWQIDPFGHSNTQAWLLSAEAGMNSLFWGRTDYQDMNHRYQTQGNPGLEWIWQGSQSLGDSAQVFAGELFGTGGGGYGTWIGFDKGDVQVQDDPSRHDYNVDEMVDSFINNAITQDNGTRTSHQLWACGSDFQYQNADHWYHNLDKLIHYVNQNGSINAFYSTPSFYVEQKLKAGVDWEVREDDIFPLADAAHHYWSGYFTSRPALKRQVRFASNLLQAARQLETIANVSKSEVDTPTVRPSPPVGDGWTDSLEGTIGVATHHDGMSGTERQDVSDDYEQRIAESQVEVEAGIEKSLNKLMGTKVDLNHCGCAQMNTCLNMSMCAFTAGQADGFGVVAWSPLGRTSEQWIRVPVTGDQWVVTDQATGEKVVSQAVEIDDITRNLPLLYINYFGLNQKQIDAKKEEYANKATHVLSFKAALPAIGFNTFAVSKSSSELTRKPLRVREVRPEDGPVVVDNGVYQVEFDPESGFASKLTNLKSKISADLKIEWGWYNSSVGGCTKEIPGPPASEKQCDGQASGAYMFRPNTSTVFYPGPETRPTVTVVQGDVVTEVRQVFSDWASHVVRLWKDSPYVEVEWTAGPIPTNTPWIKNEGDTGKEVIVRYSTSLKTKGVFYTDANGRELVRREINKRGPSYPPFNISEPVAGNYYPVNAMLSLEDKKAGTQFTVLTDVSQGGASLKDGQLELMVHRRVLKDDSRGVQEPLNETMCGCNDINAPPGQMGEHGTEGDGGCICAGLTMRGRHWLVLDTVESANEARRQLQNQLNFPATLAFAAGDSLKPQVPRFSGISEALPENVKLMTITNNYRSSLGGKILIRLAHLYSVGEHPTLSTPAQVDLKKIFAAQGLTVKSAEEMSLTGNQGLKEMDEAKLDFKTYEPYNYSNPKPYNKRVYMSDDLVVTLRPMELRTLLVELA